MESITAAIAATVGERLLPLVTAVKIVGQGSVHCGFCSYREGYLRRFQLVLPVFACLLAAGARADEIYDREYANCVKLRDPAAYRDCFREANKRLSEREKIAGTAERRKAPEDGKAAKSKRAADDSRSPARAALVKDYQQLLASIYPQHRNLTVRVLPLQDGFGLYGMHPTFNQRSFQGGTAGPAVQEWLDKNRRQLVQARIQRVGVWNDRDGSTASFRVEAH